MTTTEWPQVTLLRRRPARQLAIRPRDLSPLARKRFDHLVAVRCGSTHSSRTCARPNPGDETAAVIAAAALSEAARLALRDLVRRERRAGMSGRCRTRTCGHLRVRQALYQLS